MSILEAVPQLSPLARLDRSLEWRFEEARRLAALDPARRRFYRDLVLLRTRMAKDVGLPPYQVMTNRQLLTVCELFPDSQEELIELSGLGRVKILAIGSELIALAKLRRREGASETQNPAH